MSFSIGIVGLPNVGKSTLFKALTRQQVDTSNYPFCTIDPNVGVVPVPDTRLDQLAEKIKPTKVLPTTIEFHDIAGLVKGAHKGEGLGNQFLSHIRRVDAIAHMIRNFESANVTHVSGAIDPASDATVVNLELVMADLSLVEKRLAELKSKIQAGETEAQRMTNLLKRLQICFREALPVRELTLDKNEEALIKELNLLTLKPMVYVVSQDEDKQPEHSIDGIEPRVVLSAKLEARLAELTSKEQEEYLHESNFEGGGVKRLVEAAYKLLNLVTFFTTQNNILQAWIVPKETPIAEAVGKIHTDFQTGFVKAGVIQCQDLIKAGSEAKARKKGLIRNEGRNYIVKDGDIIQVQTKK